MSTFFDALAAWDNCDEFRTRYWINQLQTQLTAAGFIQTGDTGQINPNVYPTACLRNAGESTTAQYVSAMANSGTGTGQTAMFDGNVATFCAYLTPTATAPIEVCFDAGPSTTNTAASYRIYFLAANTDPSTWKLQGSSDLHTWTTLDTQTSYVAGGAGFGSFPISSPGAYRAYRLYITANKTAVAGQMAEFQLLTAGSVNFCTPTMMNNTGALQNATAIYGYQVWRFNDTLQSTNPCFFKLEFGQGTCTGGAPCTARIRVNIGNGSNGFGTINGAGLQTTMDSNLASGSIFNPTINLRNAYSYATNGSRISIAGAYNYAACAQIIVLERLKDVNGNDVGTGVACVLTNTTNIAQFFQCVCRTDGNASPPVETLPGCLMSTATSQNRGGAAALGEWVPFIYSKQYPMLGLVTYKTNDIQKEASFTANIYGGTHTYYPVGTAWGNAANRSSNTGESIAILYE